MTLTVFNQSETKLVAVKGVLSTVFGLACIIALFFEDKNFTILAYTFGTATAISGLLTLLSIIHTKTEIRNFGLFHYEGLLSLLLGIWVLTFPAAAMNVFMGMLGGICAGMGLVQIALAFDLRSYTVKEGILIFSGIVTVLLGIILMNNPYAIAAFINLLLGVFFSAMGGRIIRSAYQKLKTTLNVPPKQPVKTLSMQPTYSYAAVPVEQQKSSME
ncbi:DUF308 domain-containing protein [Rhodocytophaga aerolata]|uniref:DUF308 domain-containing protein n=1 Tax=Rhodocytophaga aerolata TaxID=455078 RepID=A0ABT8R0X8_9BACT|nr:DUF308 domain-containing protein [Rhodocytophaga aerolata]MDO1445747.1 DUF308 domain-containing protein [Rhodocytophaga aerolata]